MRPNSSQAPDRRRRLLVVALVALLATACAAPARVLLVRLEDTPTVPAEAGLPADYETAVAVVSALLTEELGLPLPREFRVFVYPTGRAYTAGLVDVGGFSTDRAAQIAGYSAGLGQPRRLFVNDEALRDVPRSVWLGVLAHELTHVVQYELAGGQRGRSEQWLREGMADWVACWVVERLGGATLREERERAERAVARGLRALSDAPVDLVQLGRPVEWEGRHLRPDGDRLTYQLALLLADELIRRNGFDRLLAYFRAFAHSDDRFGHFRRAFGVSVRQFEAEALRHLQDHIGSRAED